MLSIMRTTVTIDDELLRSAKERAAQLGVGLGDVVNQALQRELLGDRGAARPEIPVFRGGTGAVPGIDLRSNRALYEVLDEDVSSREPS